MNFMKLSKQLLGERDARKILNDTDLAIKFDVM